MSKQFYDNRELSWLKFNARVLEEANDETTPIFERLRFVQIFCSNLDEFFMIRVGSLHDKMLYDPKDRDNKTNLTERTAFRNRETGKGTPADKGRGVCRYNAGAGAVWD